MLEPGFGSIVHWPASGWRRPSTVCLSAETIPTTTGALASDTAAGVIRSPLGETSVTLGGPESPVSWMSSPGDPRATVNVDVACAACAVPAGLPTVANWPR